MLKQFIAICGEPGTGKTTLMRRLIEGFIPGVEFESGLVRGVYFEKRKIILLGVYRDDEVFAGTDRLSMAVQPQVITWLKRINDHSSYSNHTVVFEGDRLSSKKLFDAIRDYGIRREIFFLKVSEEERKRRYVLRGSNQAETFLRGRITKVENLSKAYPHYNLNNETESDLTANVLIITNMITGNGD